MGNDKFNAVVTLSDGLASQEGVEILLVALC